MQRSTETIPFGRPTVTGAEKAYLERVFRRRKFGGSGPFSERCRHWLASSLKVPAVFLTSSCTHALEMAALLCDLEPGQEVILPSYTFPSTAAAFVRCGARLVFVDVVPDTMNIDPEAVAQAITPRTRVVVVVHYAGVACDLDKLKDVTQEHDILLVEDAAQAVGACQERKPLGTTGAFGCYSFHESKNLQCGQGGALLVNQRAFVERAEIILEKGMDRRRFVRGEVDRYSWMEVGSSYCLGELNAAFLLAQLEREAAITAERVHVWDIYREALRPLEEKGRVELPRIPQGREHNGHIFWLKTGDVRERQRLISYLTARRIQSVFHFVPLHSAPAGRCYGRFFGEDVHTTRDSQRLLRLPLFHGFRQAERVAEAVISFYSHRRE